MSAISDLLTQARDAHAAYREALPRRLANGSSTVAVAGDVEVAGNHLADACRFRAEAHVLDPDRVDPAWADEQATYPHLELLDFYVAQLTQASAQVQATIVDLSVARETVTAALDPESVAIAPAPVSLGLLGR